MNRIEQAIRAEMARNSAPFYLYDEATIREQTARLQRDLPDFEFLYSIKTNPFAPVLKTVLDSGFGLDAASLGEVLAGVEYGLPKEKILYSAPGKTPDDLRGAADHAILIADSLHELELLEQIAAERGGILEVGVRVNPAFTMDGDVGVSGKFGIDEELLFARREWIAGLSHLKLVGIHVHARSQELQAEVLHRYYGRMCDLALRCVRELGMRMDFVNMGGGLGIAYSTVNDSPLDTADLGTRAAALAAEMRAKLPETRLIIETGRYVVCTAGYYATPIVDIKESRGSKYLLVQNTLNGFIRPSLAMLVAGYLPAGAAAKANEPLFTAMDAFDFALLTDEQECERVTLMGNLCTAADVMAKDILLPKAKIGDVLVISKAGSYAYVLSPVQFAYLPAPAQKFLTAAGELV